MKNHLPISPLIYSSDSSLHPALGLPLGQKESAVFAEDVGWGGVFLMQRMGSNDAAFARRKTTFAFKANETEAGGI